MIDFTQLDNEEYIYENLGLIYSASKQLEKALDILKAKIKNTDVPMEDSLYIAKPSTSASFVANNMLDVLREYPYEQYPEIYNITLSAKAGDVITNQELVSLKETKKVIFSLKK